MPDLITFGETMLRLSPPRGDRLATTDTFDVRIGGAESNVAVAAARLGADAVWLSKLPDTQLGERVVGELRQHGVRTGVSWEPAGETRLGTYYLEHGGEPRGTTVRYDREGSAFHRITPGELPTNVFDTATYFHTTGITPALSTRTAETTAALLETAGEADVTRSFDLNYRAELSSPEEAHSSFESLVPEIDVLFVPLRDARTVLGFDSAEPVEVAHGLETEYDLETVVITRGDRGAVSLRDGEINEQDAFHADTHDDVGSGDAFVGAYLATRIKGGSVPKALEYGAATASLKRTIDGDVAVVTPDEVDAVIENATDRR